MRRHPERSAAESKDPHLHLQLSLFLVVILSEAKNLQLFLPRMLTKMSAPSWAQLCFCG
jgi:hypothetical protein